MLAHHHVIPLFSSHSFVYQEQGILEKWESSAWAKRLAAKKLRGNLSDFDRFKVMIAKKQKSKIVADKLAELKA